MTPITLKDLYKQGEDIKVMVEKHYVRKEEFIPIKLIVYGAVAIILSAVVGKGMSFITSQPPAHTIGLGK